MGGNGRGEKLFMSEKELNTADLSGVVIMESIGNPEEEVKLDTPVPVLHINICKGTPPL